MRRESYSTEESFEIIFLAVPQKKREVKDLSKLTYEAAFERLEAIVAEMENGDLELETLINQYEHAMQLRKICLDKLAQAEAKIQTLEEKPEGKFSLKILKNEDRES